ncbi:MAG: PEP-CTERM sorting domain-containing protein [Armatimonadetes bacterium]|nr:PEP-CTERM sorting domain-containing protein [Armatimonadota bacterium]
MKRTGFVLAALAALSSSGFAYSFAGDDWGFSYNATFNVVTTLLNTTLNESASNQPTTVTQSDLTHFQFDANVGPLTGLGDFVVTGNTVEDINSGKTTDPFDVNTGAGVVTVRLTYPTFSLIGDITGINAGSVDGFGERAHEITGQTTTINNITVELLLGTNWVNLGNSSNATVNSWSLVRPADPVPEPATLGLLSLGALALLKRRKS